MVSVEVKHQVYLLCGAVRPVGGKVAGAVRGPGGGVTRINCSVNEAAREHGSLQTRAPTPNRNPPRPLHSSSSWLLFFSFILTFLPRHFTARQRTPHPKTGTESYRS